MGLPKKRPQRECIVIGGGAAGLSAALVLGRARRRTLLVDAGAQSNLPARTIGGLLGFDGRAPEELYAAGRRELSAYPSVEHLEARVTSARGSTGRFAVELDDGRCEIACTVVLATGVQYQPPDIPGVAELWGTTVFHCPFCHGWEARDQPLAVLANGDKALHATLLARAWTDDLVLLTDGPAEIDDDGMTRLSAAGVRVMEQPVNSLKAHDGRLSAVVFGDGSTLPRSGLLVATTLQRRSDLAEQLGLTTHDSGPVVVDPVDVDHLGRTTVDGVFAAGDVCTQATQVANAVASGALAGMAAVQSLLAEEFGLPFPPRKD